MNRTSSMRADGEELLDELREIYREVDAMYSGWSCPSSTECCRFGVTGREPYVTSLELAAVRRAVAANGGKLSPRRRALPLTKDPARERMCELLDARGRCSVYESRPFGCRTFYCSRATPGETPGRAELKALADRLRNLSARHESGGDAPRPLSRAL